MAETPLLEFVRELDAARSVPKLRHDVSGETVEPENWEQDIAHAALAAVARYLPHIIHEPPLLAPINHLLAALDDAKAGLHNRLLAPARQQDRTRLTLTADMEEAAVAAAAVTILRRKARKKPSDAIELVAAKLGREPDALGNLWRRLNKPANARRADGKSFVSAEMASAYAFWISDYEVRSSDISPADYVSKLLNFAEERTLKKG